MKTRLSIIILAVVVCCVLFKVIERGSPRDEAKVVPKERGSLVSLLNPHESREKTLSIGNFTFRHLCGEWPYYLRVPELDSVFFVTVSNYTPIYHLYDLKSHEDVKIDSCGTTLGYAINRTNSNEFESLEGADSNEVRIASHVDSRETVYHLDLRARRTIFKDILELGEHNEVTNKRSYRIEW